jgi:hypothetical protein
MFGELYSMFSFDQRSLSAKILSCDAMTLGNLRPGSKLLFPDLDPNLKWIRTVCRPVPYTVFFFIWYRYRLCSSLSKE